MSKPSTAIPLSQIPESRSARIVSVGTGRNLGVRLATLGLIPGATVTVISNRGNGPFIIGMKESRIVLGRGMAHKIMVNAL